MSRLYDSPRALADVLGLRTPLPPGGGRVASAVGPVFLKRTASLDQAQAECDGLSVLSPGPFRVPDILGVAPEQGGGAWLALEGLSLEPPPRADAGQLARLLCQWHQSMPGEAFGWRRNNYIGDTPQDNRVEPDWAGFFARQRLVPQLERARSGLPEASVASVEAVIETLPQWLAGDWRPVRLHGDLWRGNLGWCRGQPALYDPAVYFGPAEADWAMLELFGEPVPGLVRACQAIAGVDDGYPVRRDVYQLYHLLNHFNLFGAAWLGAIDNHCHRLLTGVRT